MHVVGSGAFAWNEDALEVTSIPSVIHHNSPRLKGEKLFVALNWSEQILRSSLNDIL